MTKPFINYNDDQLLQMAVARNRRAEVARLREWGKLTYKQIGGRFGFSAGLARVHYQKAVSRGEAGWWCQ